MLATLKFLVGSCQHVFRRYYHKTVLLLKKVVFTKNNLHHQKAHKKLHIRHLNGHLNFSSS